MNLDAGHAAARSAYGRADSFDARVHDRLGLVPNDRPIAMDSCGVHLLGREGPLVTAVPRPPGIAYGPVVVGQCSLGTGAASAPGE